MLASDFIPKTRSLFYLTGGVVVRKCKKEHLFKIVAVEKWESHFVRPIKKQIKLITNIQRMQHMYRERSPYYHATIYGCVVAARSPLTTADAGVYVV